MRLYEAIRVRLPSNRTGVLTRRGRDISDFSPRTCTKELARGHSKKVTVRQPEGQALPKARSAGSAIVGFRPLEL